MEDIFGYVMEGGELGLLENAPSLFRAADSIAAGVLSRLSIGDADNFIAHAQGMVQRMRSTPALRMSAWGTLASQRETPAFAPGAGGTVDNLNAAVVGDAFQASGAPVSIAYAGTNRIASITAYGENAQGGTTEAPVALTGVDSVHVCGRNLLPLPYSQVSETKNGLNIAVNADGTITVSGTATAETYLNLKPIPASLYRLMGVTGIVPAYDYPVTKNGFTFFDLTIQPHVEFALVYIVITKGSVVNRTYRPYIIKSAEPLPYETYQGSVTPIPIPRPLRRVGDVKDKCVTRQKHEGAEKLVVTYNVGYIASYAGESITTAWISSTGALSTGAEVAYVLSSPEVYATDPLDIDNAAGPLTVMTGGEVEVRMTELVGSRTYDADGDGVVDEAEKVSNALTLKNAAGEVVATFDGSEAAILQLTAALVGALGKTEKAADSSKLAGLAPVVDNPGPNNRNTWYFPFTGTNNRDGTRKYYAALYADNATTAGRASNLSMGLNGTDLWVYYS